MGVLTAGLGPYLLVWSIVYKCDDGVRSNLNSPPPPAGVPFAAGETDPVAVAPGAFADVYEGVELHGNAEVEFEVRDGEVEI